MDSTKTIGEWFEEFRALMGEEDYRLPFLPRTSRPNDFVRVLDSLRDDKPLDSLRDDEPKE